MRRLTLIAALSVPFCLWFAPPDAHSQTVEDRLERLERQVRELRAIHQPPDELPEELMGNEHVRWGYPGGDCTLLVKEHYVICHDDTNRVADWVTYRLNRENLQGDVSRTDNFRPDPELTSGERAELVDYRRSGYDRGHMAPAAAFKRSRTAMSETFLLSNMAPQRPNLNRRIWRMLEEHVRSLARAHGSIWVFTGTFYVDDAGNRVQPATFIGPNQVAVPTHFFKAILCEHTTGAVEMFAFIMPNQLRPVSGKPRDYLVSVDEVESLSGLDFFTVLSDPEENRLEAAVATNWPIR